MKKLLDKMADYFLPSGLELNSEEMIKARVLINSCFLASTLIFIASLNRYFLTDSFPSVSLYIIAAITIIPFLIKKVKNYQFIFHFFPTITLFLLPLVAYFRGGLDSNAALWFVALPVSSLYFIGPRKGIIYSLIGLTFLIAFLHLHITPFEFPEQVIKEEEKILHHGIGLICLFIFNTYLTWHYEKSTIENQTRLKTSQEKALQANKTKDIFWANISHEIRTPLNGILGMTNLLLDSRLSKEQKEYLDIIRDSAENLNIILSDVIDYSKIETNEIEIQRKPFSLIRTLDQVLEVFEHQANEKDIKISYSIDTDVPNGILTDEARLRQILINLVANAIKFTDQGFVKILVERGSRRDMLIFNVEDTGIGIPQSKREKLFKPFSQLDEGSSRRYGGTGLGLVICKNLVELLGGKINVESHVGQGTTFSFSIRIMPIQTKNHISEASDEDKEFFSLRTSSLKILVAEDNPVNRRLIISLLNKNGYNPDIAENGLEAVELAKKNKYELIFMDLQMPVMDGFTATQQILELYPEERPKIVAVTANVLQEDRDKCFEAGMDDFLAKPINNNLLVSILERYSKQLYGYKQSFLDIADNSQEVTPIRQEETYLSFDVLELLDNYSDDMFVIETMVNQFSERYEEDLKIIHDSILTGDFSTLELKAHSMKGSFASLFCKKGLSYSIQLERMGKTSSNDNAIAIINELKIICAELVVELQDFIEKRKEAA
jgi:signal transduction histidine kinase/CheY-like chemotaxis protein/HPt (histidine-containing phosphotransfer) domain-containing protein